jgi:hypothetical protein
MLSEALVRLGSNAVALVFRFRHLLPFAALARANVGTKRNTSN